MANLQEKEQWDDGIYQIETSDPVLGGADGIANRAAKALGNRTAWLKKQIEQAVSGLSGHIAAANPHSQYAQKATSLTGYGITNAVGFYGALPAQKAEQIIYVPPYGFMEWHATASMYRATDCGAIILHPSATARPGTIKANGAALSKTVYAGLWSWAQENNLVVASGSWAAGTAMYADLSGDNFRLPDLRGEFLRAWDDGRCVDSERGIGTWQNGTHITGDNGFGPAVHGIGNLATVNVDSPDELARDLYHLPTTNVLSNTSTYWGRVRPRNVALTACIKF